MYQVTEKQHSNISPILKASNSMTTDKKLARTQHHKFLAVNQSYKYTHKESDKHPIGCKQVGNEPE